MGVGSIPWSPLARGLLTRPLKDKSRTKRGKNDLLVLLLYFLNIYVYSYMDFSGDLLERYEEGAGTEKIVKAYVLNLLSLSYIF
jgi:aryl-alcohol dehydrogenase-like predicted oxidoreductase